MSKAAGNRQKQSGVRRLIRALASLKLAVVIVVGLGGLTAWGTFVEAEYNAEIAGKVVYHSYWMYGLLGLLCVSLTAVMVDRWPWKKRHAPFVLAHIGILILIFGSVLTRYYGVDGSMVFGIGEANKFVVVGEPQLTVYSSLDAQSFTPLFQSDHDFYTRPPTAGGIEVPFAEGKMKIVDYLPFAIREQKVVAGQAPGDPPAIRFQLQNANVNMTDWLMGAAAGREATKDLGPARIILTSREYRSKGENAIVLRSRADGESLDYEIHSRRDPAGPGAGVARRGTVRAGGVIETPWMGMVMRILNYLPAAKEEVSFHPRSHPTPLTTAALKIQFNDHQQWIALDSMVKFFSDSAVYIVSYANRRIDLTRVFDDPTFELKLKKFSIGRYQGTMRAASYESLVSVPGQGDVLISMNEPLKYKGFTFYQASFQEDESGRPTASILSVNRDPGRPWKYLGSTLIVLGSFLLFYNRRKAAKGAAGALS